MSAPAAIYVPLVIRRSIGTNMVWERHFDAGGRKTTLHIYYHWLHNHARSSVEILPVGRKRYAIIRNGKADVPVFVEGGRELLSALSDFRHSAAIALDDLRVWQREAG